MQISVWFGYVGVVGRGGGEGGPNRIGTGGGGTESFLIKRLPWDYSPLFPPPLINPCKKCTLPTYLQYYFDSLQQIGTNWHSVLWPVRRELR
jgi:hypothetical protein